MKSSRIFWIWWLSTSSTSHGFRGIIRHCEYPKSSCLSASQISFHSRSNHNDTVSLVQGAVEKLAKRGKTWSRLKHLVELANENQTNNKKVIVDVGTDHGILPIAWASSGNFQKAIGVDASNAALEKGGNALLQEVLDYPRESSRDCGSIIQKSSLPVEFRCGNGLACIGDNEADIICIAGMGVNTMMQILDPSQLERVGCKLLLLQPTNSKPRNLVNLYDALQTDAWRLQDERIEKISSRWYLSVAFSLRSDKSEQKLELPGTKLMQLEPSSSMRATFDDYLRHHRAWLKADEELPGGLKNEEVRWLNAFNSNL